MSTSKSTVGQKVLTDEQRLLLEHWLLDESPPLTYEQAEARMLREFNIRLSHGSVVAFFQHRSQERLVKKLTDSAQATAPVREQFGNLSPKVFETLMEMGGLAAIEARLQAERPSMNQICQIVQLASLGLRARNQAAMVRLRERALALREKMYQDSLPADDLPPEESSTSTPPAANLAPPAAHPEPDARNESTAPASPGRGLQAAST